jgi:hypothetical protein
LDFLYPVVLNRDAKGVVVSNAGKGVAMQLTDFWIAEYFESSANVKNKILRNRQNLCLLQFRQTLECKFVNHVQI